MSEHTHDFIEDERDENDNRIRTHARCACGARRAGAFAHRLDEEGRQAWGPSGVWQYWIDASEASS